MGQVEKPRLYIKYYPKSNRWYWMVSHMPKPITRKNQNLWARAHDFAAYLTRKYENRIPGSLQCKNY